MKGLPLVMLHGWALNLRVFDDLVRRLEDWSRSADGIALDITRLDLPGHGRALEPPAIHRHDPQQGWDIGLTAEHLLRQMPEKFVLLGWSLGAKISMEIAARAPQRLLGLILVSPTPRFSVAPDWPHGAEPAVLDLLARNLREDYRRTVGEFLGLQVRGSANATETLATLRAALLGQGECPGEVLQRSLQLLHDIDQRPRLSLISAPTLVIAGQYDRVVHPEASRALASLIPGAHFVEIARCGHAPFLSHVTEFTRYFEDFLRTLQLPAPQSAEARGARR
jgi:pimeloyl-[acyl-carrier protein] methyl ester esterase